MVRLYKALMNTGASVEIKPAKEIMGVMYIFRYKGKEHKTVYTLESVTADQELIEDMICVELVKFVQYVNAHNA